MEVERGFMILAMAMILSLSRGRDQVGHRKEIRRKS